MATDSVPTNYKRYVDETFVHYLPKVKTLRTLYNEVNVDPATTSVEYAKLTQSYTEAAGYNAFALPEEMAEGTNAPLDSMGTEDASSNPTKYGKGFWVTDEEARSNRQFIREMVAWKTVEAANSLERKLNATLASNMIGNAGISYSASATWISTGDPFSDLPSAKNSFRKRSGGLDPDFIACHPDDFTEVEKNDRVQNVLYSPNTKFVEQGKVYPNLLGLTWVVDPAITNGTFVMGKKGMFADLFIPLKYTVHEQDKGAAGKYYEATMKFVDQYKRPYYLLAGTGI